MASRTPAKPVRRGPTPAAVAAAVSVGAVRAFALGLVVAEALAVLAWATDPRSGAGSGAALRSGALLWLVGHGGSVAVAGGRYALPPLALTLLLAWFPYRGGVAVTRTFQPRPIGYAAWLGAAIGVPYAVLAALLTGLARSAGARPAPWRALLCALLVAAVAGALGGMRARGWAAYWSRLPDRARLVLAGAAASAATLVAGGALGTAAALAWHLPRAASLTRALRPGLLGGLVLLLLCVAYVPNAVVWCVAFAAGTGFAVGAGSTVAPTGVSLGPLPAFPLLAALPGGGAAPRPALLLFAVPVLAGVVAGLTVVRYAPGLDRTRAAGWAALTGPVVGGVVVLACVVSSGAAGPGRLATTGPQPFLTGLAVAEWVTFVAAATAAFRAARPPG